MKIVTGELKEKLFSFLLGNITLLDIEHDIYTAQELEQLFDKDDYLELISLDFDKKSSHYDAVRILEKGLDMAEYQLWQFNAIFESVIHKKHNYPQCIASLYELYCSGYRFLQVLGIGYGLVMAYPPGYNYTYYLELTKSIQLEIADSFYPHIIEDVMIVKNIMDTKKIVLTGQPDEDGFFRYYDNRSDEEKTLTEYTFWSEIKQVTRQQQ